MTGSSQAMAAALADAVGGLVERRAASTPAVRGSDWQTAVVTAVNSDGTVDIGTVRARRLAAYQNPTVGDLIAVTQSGAGNWIALGRTASSDDAVGQWKVARKTSDTSRTSNATPSDDPHLTFTVTAGAVYTVEGWIKYSAIETADITLDWTIPSGALGEWTGHGNGLAITAADTAGYLQRTEANDVDQARNYGGVGGSNFTVLIAGTLRVGSTGGTYAMQWSQGTSNATATTVYTDSWLRLTRVA